ncbi:hypothetical protein [Vulcanisaeta distributa]|uniref:Uncharacterized protein n=1 Tax=Vulcanisaeta distributa (strain DSM 14429 / JCM 11212 / NBRC 100878 / IC-017) TaxID=572478 RepID=E1QNS0_VULDI|nr:hypothetical protein Vdis_0774 [Vulcanisaeta distributa DSM 14429]
MINVSEPLSIDVLEGAYQLINYDDEDEEALTQDFNLRYGDRYMEVLERAREFVSSLGEDASNRIRRFYGLLADHSMSRVKGFGDAVYALIKYMGLGGDEGVLKVQFRLMGFNEDVLTELIRAGVLMHRRRGILFVPEYLIPRLLEMSGDIPTPNVRELISALDALGLVAVESAAFGSRPINWLFRAIYGVDFREFVVKVRIGNVLDGSIGELILNPAIDLRELRMVIHEMKDSSARSMRRIISPHGQYTYSRVARCGIVYTVFGEGGRELIMLYPWIVPSRRVLDYHPREDRVIVIMQRPSEEFVDIMREHINDVPPRTGFVFISGNEAMVYKPQSLNRAFDSFLDFLYRSNLRVAYLN